MNLALKFHVIKYSKSLDCDNCEVTESCLVVNLVDFGSKFGSYGIHDNLDCFFPFKDWS